jgi:hypothetical protein
VSIRLRGQSVISKSRRKDEPVPLFFVDRNLSDEDVANALRALGFKVIGYYDHYTADRVPNPQTVPDQDIIPECSLNEWALLTSDKSMEFAHFKVIRDHPLAIFVVPDNTSNPWLWADTIVK